MSHTLGVGFYSFRATFRRQWNGYLAIVLLIGLLGGLAMGSISAARRTESSFPVFWASRGSWRAGRDYASVHLPDDMAVDLAE